MRNTEWNKNSEKVGGKTYGYGKFDKNQGTD